MKTKVLSLIFLAVILFGISAAADTGVIVEYDAAAKEVFISGNIGEVSELVTLMILPSDVVQSSIDVGTINKEKYCVKVVRCDRDGSFSAGIILPQWYKSGAYKIYACYGTNVISGDFLHINDEEGASVIKLLNAAGKSSEFADIIGQNLAALGIEEERYNAYKDDINTALFVHRPSSGYTLIEFVNEYRRITALMMIKDGKAEQAVEAYASAFGIEYEDYKALESKVKNRFSSNVALRDVINESSQNIFMESYIMACVYEAPTYSKMREYVIKYKDELKLNMSDYNALSEYKKSAVFSELFNMRPETVSELKSGFEGLAASSAGQSTVTGGGGTSSGGGYKNEFGVAGQLPADTGKTSDAFYDIINHWAKDEVLILAQSGIVNGYEDGSFRPDNEVSRAEFTKMLITALNMQGQFSADFEDVSPDDWFYDCVAAAEYTGLAKGYNNCFYPNSEILREDAAVLLYRAASYKGVELTGEFYFEDGGNISDYAKEAVEALGAAGIINGYDMHFMPKNNITRAEASALICRLIQII